MDNNQEDISKKSISHNDMDNISGCFYSSKRMAEKIIFELVRKCHIAWYNHVISNQSIYNKIISFQCNICGQNNNTLASDVFDREKSSCHNCLSNLRTRSIIHIMSCLFFGKSIISPDFPVNKSISGIGLSDWNGYANILADKLSYHNTFYHKQPQFDLLSPPNNSINTLDFVICSDVIEHVSPPAQLAFNNLANILKPGGICIVTVPYMHYLYTLEHFPDLYKYNIVNTNNGNLALQNTTRDGKRQFFDNLSFHGGSGATLEMRIFAKIGLLNCLRRAGFSDIRFHRCSELKYGISWPYNWSLPVTARKPSHSNA